MNKISEQILVMSFLNELEKISSGEKFLSNLLHEADSVAGNKGVRAGLKVFERHKDPLFDLPKGALKKIVPQAHYEEGVGKIQRGVAKGIGNISYGIGTVIKDVDKNKSLSSNILGVIKNFSTLLTNQLRAARYKTLPSSKVVLTGPQKKYIEGNGLLNKFKVFNRKIEGKTSAGDYIVKKRKAILPLSYAVTPVGFGAGALILGSGKRDETVVDRATDAGIETALWTVAPGVAQARLVSDILK